ncbi:MAG: UDP-N-acetylmuramoyl-L-alanyl-D-glutamate--2,6-diaminopimelate ligase [Balneolaceae bacterium]
MTFQQLIELCDPIDVTGDPVSTIGALRHDSRNVEENDVFIAVRGLRTDGHDHIPEAASRGASVLVCEQNTKDLPSGVAAILVKETRPLLGPLAQAFAGYPAREMTLVGITGTNGKTTVATLIWQVLKELGAAPALLGTVAKRYGNQTFPSSLTTSDPIELAEDMKQMAKARSTHLVMEVSSHALSQDRTLGLSFDLAVFTNLSHDHLDYHGHMEQYAVAKKKLFDQLPEQSWALINVDDSHWETMIANCRANILDFSFTQNSSVQCEILEMNETGTTVRVDDVTVTTPLIGRFNAYNLAEAYLASTLLGFEAKAVAEALKHCQGAAGRLEKVSAEHTDINLPVVLVDYAHTPDALQNVAETVAALRKKGEKLILLFGCGGDRDRAKRPVMARVAESVADQIIVTSDNPRSEEPEKIIREIENGFSSSANWTSIPSREEAIRQAIQTAPSNSWILIAGKGHETWLESAGKKIQFDDRKIASDALNRRAREQKAGGIH